MQSMPLTCLVAVSVLTACARIDNAPVNVALSEQTGLSTNGGRPRLDASEQKRSTLIAVTLSGGGMRSAAFGWGALSHLSGVAAGDASLGSTVRVVAGVSAGAILGAHFAMAGPTELPTFKERFLDKDVQSALRTTPTPENLIRAAQGGVNDRSGLPAWLASNLFGRTTLGDLDRGSRPRLIIHATDMQNRSPFLFEQASFDAVCSDRSSFPLAEAIAASAAVPVLFAPVVIQNFRGDCLQSRSATGGARTDQKLSRLDRHGVNALRAYRDGGSDRFIKLNDGGLVDNLGTSALMSSANLAGRPGAPFAVGETDFARNVLFLIVDGSTRKGIGINATLDGPGAVTTIAASVDAMIDTASRRSIDVMERWVVDWRKRIVGDRCARALPRCDQLTARVLRIALEDLTDDEDARRFAISTTALRLPPDDVTFFARKGRDLLRSSTAFKDFVWQASQQP